MRNERLRNSNLETQMEEFKTKRKPIYLIEYREIEEQKIEVIRTRNARMAKSPFCLIPFQDVPFNMFYV